MQREKNFGCWKVEDIPLYDYAESFHEGLAFVEKNYKQSFINTDGKVVIRHSSKRELDDICRCGRVQFTTISGNGFLNKKGKVVISPKHFIAEGFFNGRCVVVNENQKHGIINLEGDFVIKNKLEFIDNFSSGLAAYIESGLKGYLDINGTTIIAPCFEQAGKFEEGLAKVLKPGRKHHIIIDVYNNELFSTRKFQTIEAFNEKLAAVKIKDRWGFVDTSGEIVIEPKYMKTLSFREGLAPVQYEDKAGIHRWGFIDARGKEVVGPAFAEVRGFFEGVSAVRRMNEWGFIDKMGKFIVEPQFAEVTDVSEGYTAVGAYNGTKFIKFM